MKTISLNGIWKLSGKLEYDASAEKTELEARVPGCVQLDLSRSGYLPEDLYMGMNITETEKYEDYEWWYEKSFTAPEERERVFIVFEGVDCIAEYFINGEKIGESENMFIAHEFDISKYLRDGENTLCVHIKSPVIYTHSLDFPVKHYENWDNDVTNTGIRRAPHTYGWDIMPRAVTSGLWRGVRIEVRDRIYFSQLYFKPTDKDCAVFCQLECAWEDLLGIEVEIKGSCGADSTFYAKRPFPLSKKRGKAAIFGLDIKEPKAWMPYGYGEANVYDGTASIYKDGELVTAYIVNGNSETTLELLGNGDFGKYTVVIEDEAGNSVSYEFEKQFATNTFSNIFICLLLVSLGVIGIIYIRFNGKVRTK